MAVPKGRVSKSKRDKRKAQSWKIATPNLVKCSKCGETVTFPPISFRLSK